MGLGQGTIVPVIKKETGATFRKFCWNFGIRNPAIMGGFSALSYLITFYGDEGVLIFKCNKIRLCSDRVKLIVILEKRKGVKFN